MLEIVGLASRAVMLVIVPCIVSSGVGALLFTGLGHWTGLPTGSLALPDVSATTLDAVDLLLVIPLAAAVALLMHGVMVLGRRVATTAAPRPILVAVAAGVLTGALAGLFALVTGRSPVEVLGSGQQALPGLVDQTWPVGVLLLLLLCKGAAYGLCLGSFRGGPTFPAIFLGGVAGGARRTPARPRHRARPGDLHGRGHGRHPPAAGDLGPADRAAARTGGHQPDAGGHDRDGDRAGGGRDPRPSARAHGRRATRPRPGPPREPDTATG